MRHLALICAILHFCPQLAQFLELRLPKKTVYVYEFQGFRIRRVFVKNIQIKKVRSVQSWGTFLVLDQNSKKKKNAPENVKVSFAADYMCGNVSIWKAHFWS